MKKLWLIFVCCVALGNALVATSEPPATAVSVGPIAGGGQGAAAGEAVEAAVDIDWSAMTLTIFADQFFKAKPEFSSTHPIVMSWDSATEDTFQAAAVRQEVIRAIQKPFIPFAEIKNTYDMYFGGLRETGTFSDPVYWHSFPSNANQQNILADYGYDAKNIEAIVAEQNVDATDVLPFVQRMRVADDDRIIFIGDLHGSAHSLLRNLLHLAQQGYLTDNWRLQQNTRMIILGDMTDYGCYGVEVLYLLMRLKIANRNRVFFARGNHENIKMALRCGFAIELSTKYGEDLGTILFQKFQRMNACLPLAIFVASRSDPFNYVQCCHGGIEPFYNPNEFLHNPDWTKLYDLVLKDSYLPWPIFIKKAEVIKNEKEFLLCNEFATNTSYCVGQGYQWSDFCGTSNGRDQYQAFSERNKTWLLNANRGSTIVDKATGIEYRTGGAGFNANKEDIKLYQVYSPLVKAFIRGHQDGEDCCKLIQHGELDLKDWRRVCPVENPYLGTPVYNEENKDTWQVITMSSAPEAKGNRTEGYGVMLMSSKMEDWQYCIYDKEVNTGDFASGDCMQKGYVRLAKDPFPDGGDICQWHKSPEAAGITDELKMVIQGDAEQKVIVGPAFPAFPAFPVVERYYSDEDASGDDSSAEDSDSSKEDDYEDDDDDDDDDDHYHDAAAYDEDGGSDGTHDSFATAKPPAASHAGLPGDTDAQQDA
jgi:hypothetical protein